MLVQSVAWSYEALAKDMLELHDPACITAVHAFKCQRDLELGQRQHPTLADIHATCVACYTKWFQDEHANYPEADLLITVARTEQVTRSSAGSFLTPPATLQPMMWQMAFCRLAACSSWVIHQHSGYQLLQLLRAAVSDLITQLQQTAATSTFLKSLLVSLGPWSPGGNA